MNPIRPFALEDARAIARILAEGWRQAYGGFMPAGHLAPRIDPERRLREIETWLALEFDADNEGLLVAEVAHEVVGFVHLIEDDKGGLDATATINLLYVSPDRQGRGVGRQLLAGAADWLDARGHGAVALSAYEQNPFRPFYSHLGGQEAKRVVSRLGDHAMPSVLYVWPCPLALREGATRRMPSADRP